MGDLSSMTRPRSRQWTAIGAYGTAIGAMSATACLAAQTPAAGDGVTTHAALTDHIPGFITEPGQTDILFVVVIVMLLAIVLIIGNLYFQLHAVPERIAHRANKGQMEIVAVLALISLFTHNHIYWIIGLLLALVRIPDFSTPLYSIARSMARLASRDPEAESRSSAANPQVASAHPQPPHLTIAPSGQHSDRQAGQQPGQQIIQPTVKAGPQGEGM